MRTKWRSRVLFLGTLAPALAGAGGVLANGHFGRGVYAEPSAYVVDTVPTVYAMPTAYTIPTVYAQPTSYVPYSPAYVPTSYVLSPTYSYVAPRSYRRYVATGFGLPQTYVPTTVLYPSAFETQAVSGSCDPCAVTPPCCESASPLVASPPPVRAGHAEIPQAEQAPLPRPTPSTVESVPAQEPAPAPAAASTVAEPTPTVRRETSPAPIRSPARGAVDPNFSMPPDAPAHEKDAGTAATPATIQSTPITSPPVGEKPQPKTQPEPPQRPQTQPAVTPPVAPGAEGSPLDLPAPAGEAAGAVRHDVQKPAGLSAYLRSVRKGDLYKLQGKVISTETGRPEEGVTVTIANRGNTFVDRVAVSDAFGRYAFTLPDGEWTVNVTMPSGRSYPVSQLRVANGQINDEVGRAIPSLTINR